MADVAGEIDAEPAFAALQELGEGLELLPRDPAERDGIHVLHRGEDAFEERAVFGLGRGHREAAIAGDDGRDPVKAGHRRVRVERDLRVVMGVHIDDSGSDDLPGGVDLAVGRDAARKVRQLHHAPVADGDVDPPARQTGAVDHHPAAHDEVVVLGHFAFADTRHARSFPSGQRFMVPSASTVSNAPGGTSVVLSGPSTSAGPGSRCPSARSARR